MESTEIEMTGYASPTTIHIPPKEPKESQEAKGPSAWQQFRRGPCLFLARKISARRPINPGEPPQDPVTVVCISNTYNERPQIPPGDILIHAGDMAADGSLADLQATLNWLKEQPHHIKIVVAGRRDRYLNKMKKGGPHWRHGHRRKGNWGDIIYLEHQQIVVAAENGRLLRVFGSPYSPTSIRSGAFQYPRDENVWNKIPNNLDILITHTPPFSHLDSLEGCWHLLHKLWKSPPRLHVFGCVCEHYGTERLCYDALQNAMEQIEVAGGGFLNLLKVVKPFLRSFSGPDMEAKTELVNACIIREESDPHREPITVII
ncbi:hypothetical protein N7537_012125 [Penicillium hordei]|uniref:Calcineurin-like phosphoesterase domain-containing protein n=1 Tax=Penicillium hordei TaxID=40994 RepID=A0AAD6DN56_9EURO|nr:uncharacterized protein N7537_012125 [Penicillium hordei]KAJ5589447.1 hypothetical protein N7537_012125 [Penicillium hordei]